VACSHFVEVVLLWLYRLDDPVSFLYAVELVCFVLHVRVVNIIVFCYGLVSDFFCLPLVGPDLVLGHRLYLVLPSCSMSS